MITLHGEIHSSKNSRRILRAGNGRPFVAKSAAAKADEETLYWQLAEQHETWRWMLVDALWPVRVVFQFRRQSKRRFDYVNLAQGILDAMVKASYLPDDCADYVIPVFVPYQLDRSDPGCSFWIEKGQTT